MLFCHFCLFCLVFKVLFCFGFGLCFVFWFCFGFGFGFGFVFEFFVSVVLYKPYCASFSYSNTCVCLDEMARNIIICKIKELLNGKK